MTQFGALLVGIGCLTTVIGCGVPERLNFVTATQIGMSADGASQSVNIGYDRYEGIVAPIFDDGAAPPVFARLESDLSVLFPKIRQVYATGDAARIVTRVGKADSGADSLRVAKEKDEEKPRMFFGTGTNFGMQLAYRQTVLSSANLGFKRLELSSIPRSKSDSSGKYASVLAAVRIDVNNKEFGTEGLSTSEFFATGKAAKNLAARTDIQKAFKEEAEKALKGIDPNSDASIVDLQKCLMSSKLDGAGVQNWIDSQSWTGGTKPNPVQLGTQKQYKAHRENLLKAQCA